MIRKSTIEDKEIIQQLMYLCFGDNNKIEPYENLEDRYYLYFKDNTLVAMTGLTSDSEYGRLEIDWTCTHPYRLLHLIKLVYQHHSLDSASLYSLFYPY